MAACPLRRRCNCSTHAPCSTHTPSPRMRSYFGRRCYFSVHAPIVFGMRERRHRAVGTKAGPYAAVQPGRRAALPPHEGPAGARADPRRAASPPPPGQPGVHEVRYGESAARGRGLTGSAGMPKMRCIRSSERRATRWRCRARAEPYVRYVASRGLRTYGPWSTRDGSAPA